MSRGGRRPGAGRKKGAASKRTREIADQAAAVGLTPLEFMLSILRDEACPEGADAGQKIAFHTLRFEAAKAAAPYIHARLAQRDEPVKLEPLTGTFTEQAKTVLAAMAEGRLSPSQVGAVMQALAAQANLSKVDEIERRLKTLEEKRHGHN